MLIKLFDSNRKTDNNSNNNNNNIPQKAMEQHNRANKTIKSENNSSSDSMGAQLNLNANNEKMAQLSDSGKFFYSSVFCLFFVFFSFFPQKLSVITPPLFSCQREPQKFCHFKIRNSCAEKFPSFHLKKTKNAEKSLKKKQKISNFSESNCRKLHIIAVWCFKMLFGDLYNYF